MELKLLKNCNSNELEVIVQLDKLIIKKYGNSFSDEIWEMENFLFELPGKFDNSLVLFDEKQVPVAYAINSIKNDFYFYTHRFVNTVYGGAKKLMDEMLIRDKVFLLQVSTSNQRAINFYKNFGYQIVNDYNFILELFPNSFHHISYCNNISNIQKKYLMKLGQL